MRAKVKQFVVKNNETAHRLEIVADSIYLLRKGLDRLQRRADSLLDFHQTTKIDLDLNFDNLECLVDGIDGLLKATTAVLPERATFK